MNYKKIYFIFFCFLIVGSLSSQKKNLTEWHSNLIEISNDGSIKYIPDKQGNTIPDFSKVGYHHGNKSIPNYPIIKEIHAIEGDNWLTIQKAINEVSLNSPDINGHRGTILLKRGIYKISKSLQINTDGIVLKGEGDNINETRLIATNRKQHSLIEIKGKGKYQEIKGSRAKIIDSFVPVGTHNFHVSSPENFKIGNKIIIYRPATQNWIHDLKMDQIVERTGTRQWKPNEYNLSFEREITNIVGNQIWIDNPIVMEMEDKYGGGEIYTYTFEGRIREVGISDLCIESEYDRDDDLEHGWKGIEIDNAENCWIKNITSRYFGYSAVSLERFSKNITITDCRCFEPKSPITGGMRYSFNNCGQQNLIMNCQTTEGRHDFVTGARVCGPNVFYNCTASRTHADIGPHHRWAVGTLYDNIITDGDINVQDRAYMGSGHGWAGVTQVLWNCNARQAAIQNPWVSGNNYNIGMKGSYSSGSFKGRNDGIWEGLNKENVIPRSLYIAQLIYRQKNEE